MDEETEVIAAPEAEAQPEQSFEERGLKFVESQMQAASAAAESTADDAAQTETDAVAEPAKETPVETKTEEEVQPFTAEELADDAFFDKLDKDGWDRLQKLNPALHKMGKAVASARGKAYARLKGLPPEPAPETTEDPNRAKLKAAWQKSQSMDEDEAFEGSVEYSRLLLAQEATTTLGINPAATKAQALLSKAFDVAITGDGTTLPAFKELSTLPGDELDAIVEADPFLMQTLELSASLPDDKRIAMVAGVMQQAGRNLIAQKQSKAATDAAAAEAEKTKKAEAQKRLRSNANNQGAVIVDAQSGRLPDNKVTFATHGLASIEKKLKAALPPA
jgi:hypothetical protein